MKSFTFLWQNLAFYPLDLNTLPPDQVEKTSKHILSYLYLSGMTENP